MQQQKLWFDSWEEALQHDISTLGGRKVVAPRLWPSEDEETANDRLKACMARGHKQALKPSEVLKIKAWAKQEANSTALVDFEAQQLGQRIEWIDPEDEAAILMREVSHDYKRIEARQKKLESLFEKIHRSGARK